MTYQKMLWLALLCAVGLFKIAFASAQRPMNVILIMADDVGYECFTANGGQSYATPHFDKLAEQGIRFTNAFSNPICTPSRLKLMTGLYNTRNYTDFARLDRSQTTFAHMFQAKGYRTFVAGKWQLGQELDSPQHFGFDQSLLWQHVRGRTRGEENYDTRYSNPRFERNGEFIDYNDGEYGPQVLANAVCEFIERNQDQPFMVYYPMLLPHCPFVPTPDSEDWDADSLGSPSYKGDAAYFGDMMTAMDQLLGQIVAHLDDLGLRENTLIIFTGDNGTDRPIVSTWNGLQIEGKKGKIEDEGIRVPLVISMPGTIPQGLQSDALVEFSDFLPTFSEAAGLDMPAAYPGDGVSLWPVLQGKPGRVKPFVHIYFDRMTLIRNQAFAIRREWETAPFAFFDASKPYQWQPISPLRAEPVAEANRLYLESVARRLDAEGRDDSEF